MIQTKAISNDYAYSSIRHHTIFSLFVLMRLLLKGGYYSKMAFISLGSQWITTTAE